MTESYSLQLRTPFFRFVAITVAGALLNVGFYFMLFIFTPVLSGLIVGFILAKIKEGAISGFLSSVLSFLPLLLYVAPLLLIENPVSDTSAFYVALVFYALVLSLFGMLCGILGSAIGRRVRMS